MGFSTNLFTFVLFVISGFAYGSLSPTYYSSTCPSLVSIVQTSVSQVVSNEPRMCASLIRLFFHDCHVNGCDASVLLDGSNLEQNAFPNINSLRGMDVVDNIKSTVETECPGVVSCADLLALIAEECVAALNGPSWTVLFGRRDSLTASQSAANTNLPPPTSNVSALNSNFQSHGFTTQDLVALSGAHTVGQAQCTNFKARLYGPFQSSDYMNMDYNTSLQSQCPSSGGDSNLSPLDLQTPVVFDNKYFANLMNFKGLLFSDQTLFSGGNWDTAFLVHVYAANQTRFFQDFVTAMIKMGNMNVLTGTSGEVRLNCGRVN